MQSDKREKSPRRQRIDMQRISAIIAITEASSKYWESSEGKWLIFFRWQTHEESRLWIWIFFSSFPFSLLRSLSLPSHPLPLPPSLSLPSFLGYLAPERGSIKYKISHFKVKGKKRTVRLIKYGQKCIWENSYSWLQMCDKFVSESSSNHCKREKLVDVTTKRW